MPPLPPAPPREPPSPQIAVCVLRQADLLDDDAYLQRQLQLETDAPPHGGALLVSARDGSGVPELTAAISASLEASLGRARQTLRLSVSDGGALGKQLAFLHGHPRIAVVDQRDSDDGAALVVTADMDDETYRTFVGRRWK